MKEKYENLKKNYSLPDLEELEKNFEIDTIDEEENVLREILKKISEKIDFYTRTMESLLQPDASLGYMKEAAGLNSQDRTLVNKIYAEGMYILRKFTEFGLEYDEKKAAEFLSEIYDDWKLLKPDLKIILKKIKEVWKKEFKQEQDRGYFG